jgi:hypothetical protein
LESKVLLDILSIEDDNMENCLNYICHRKDQKLTEILDFLSKIFQNDRDSFKKLLNEKLRENEEVKEWMGKNYWNVDSHQTEDENSEDSKVKVSESDQKEDDSSNKNNSGEDSDSSSSGISKSLPSKVKDCVENFNDDSDEDDENVEDSGLMNVFFESGLNEFFRCNIC